MKDFTQTRIKHIRRLYNDFKDQSCEFIKLPKELPSDKCDKLPIVIIGRHPPLTGGQYVCIISFPAEYPLRPPSIEFCTPNGKFSINTQICIAGLTQQHLEQWSPATSLTNLLIGLESTLYDTSLGFGIGFLNRPPAEQTQLAQQSVAYNKKHLATYINLFDDLTVKPVEVNSDDKDKVTHKKTLKDKVTHSKRKQAAQPQQAAVPPLKKPYLQSKRSTQPQTTAPTDTSNAVVDLAVDEPAHHASTSRKTGAGDAAGVDGPRRNPRRDVTVRRAQSVSDDLEVVEVKSATKERAAGLSAEEPICL